MSTACLASHHTAAGSSPLGMLWRLWCACDGQAPQQTRFEPKTDEQDQRDIQASQQGDPDAYARLVRRYERQVSRRMWKFTRDRTEYEELVHEVFVEAYFALPRYREQNAFPAWLNRIATRVGYRYWKNNRRHGWAVGLEHWDGQDHSDTDNAEAEQAAEQLHRLLARLGPRDRLVLTLLYWEGCSVAEASQQTGWTKTMVKVQAHRARARLRKILDQA